MEYPSTDHVVYKVRMSLFVYVCVRVYMYVKYVYVCVQLCMTFSLIQVAVAAKNDDGQFDPPLLHPTVFQKVSTFAPPL